ncbi:MAG: hypothetical protein JXA21_00300 [Anaerolineae bacterium]|nr:hypothetical protein [Anaerolineae bacterium]
MKRSLFSELKALFWLQTKLTLAMFRSRRAADWFWIFRLGLMLLQAIFMFPMFIVLGIAMAVGLIYLSPQAAFEVVLIANTFMMLFWLMMPGMYNSQFMERFEMSRLFAHPISFRGIVVGSTLVSMVNMTGLWTLPILLGEAIGLAWHRPAATPLILLGTLPAFVFFALVGRLMDDFFDLVSSDRRLRTLMVFVLSLPFMFLWLGQYYLQYITDDYETLPAFFGPALAAQLEQAQGASGVLEALHLSRFLIWLPPGWVGAGMGMVVNNGGAGVLFLLLSFLTIGALLWVHSGITRRLMDGAVLRIGVERVRTRGLGLPWEKATGFWALVAKDLRYLRRSPIPRQMLFGAMIMPIVLLLPMSRIPASEMPPDFGLNISEGIGFFLLFMLNMTFNIGLTGNYFGAIDREGFGTLATAPSRWPQVLLAFNSVVTLFVLTTSFVIFAIIAAVTHAWAALPLWLYTTLVLQISTTPIYTFASIMGPYRMELKYGAQNRRGNMWGFLAWIVGLIPVGIMVVAPYFTWRPALIVTLPLSAIYSIGFYLLTLKPLGKLLQQRQHVVLERITSD